MHAGQDWSQFWVLCPVMVMRTETWSMTQCALVWQAWPKLREPDGLSYCVLLTGLCSSQVFSAPPERVVSMSVLGREGRPRPELKGQRSWRILNSYQ